MGTKIDKTIKVSAKYAFETEVYKTAIPLGLAKKNGSGIRKIDLKAYLTPNPKNTYLVRVVGDSMIEEGIDAGDILVVDSSEEPKNGKVVIAAVNGELAVKTLRVIDGAIYLFSANKNFLPIEIKPFWRFEIQGVVKHVIKDL